MNDNPGALDAMLPSPDADGQAALVLVESLIHGLCENATLSNDQAVDIVDTAVDVQHEKVEAEGNNVEKNPKTTSPTFRALTLLTAISTSLKANASR